MGQQVAQLHDKYIMMMYPPNNISRPPPPKKRHTAICGTIPSMSMSKSSPMMGKTVITEFPCHQPSNTFSSHWWINRTADADMHYVPRFVAGSADSSKTQVFYVMEKSFSHIHQI